LVFIVIGLIVIVLGSSVNLRTGAQVATLSVQLETAPDAMRAASGSIKQLFEEGLAPLFVGIAFVITGRRIALLWVSGRLWRRCGTRRRRV
jgi:hypothetical protein